MSDVRECFRMMEGRGILGVERLRHVETIEPHLVGIALFVPESAGGGSRHMHQIVIEQGGSLGVAWIGSGGVQEQKLAAQQDVVLLEFFRLPGGDGAICADKLIDRALDVVEVARIGSIKPEGIHAIEQRAQLVVPDITHASGCKTAIGPARNGRVGGTFRPGTGLGGGLDGGLGGRRQAAHYCGEQQRPKQNAIALHFDSRCNVSQLSRFPPLPQKISKSRFFDSAALRSEGWGTGHYKNNENALKTKEAADLSSPFCVQAKAGG